MIAFIQLWEQKQYASDDTKEEEQCSCIVGIKIFLLNNMICSKF
jgi:hypothetical protein